MQLNYALDRNDYTWTNALCWGISRKHFEKAQEENSFVHGLIGAIESLPIIGQIASIFEKIIVYFLRDRENAPDLADRDIVIENVGDIPPFSALQPQSIGDMLTRFRVLPGCQLFNENEEQVEIALDGERVGPNDVFTPWKLHISANPENAAAVFGVVFGALVRCRPHFKCVRNEQLLKKYNEFVSPAFPDWGHFTEGKFITICAPDEEHLLKWACELNQSLEDAIEDGRLQKNAPGAAVNRTDRPVGPSGFLWARHDMAGSPITSQDFQEHAPAPAAEGNYNITTHFPIAWVDLVPAEKDRRIQAREVGLARVVQPDVFERDWGRVAWNPEQHRFLSVI